eukprot:537497-Rhodomonas_salina.1
MCGGEARRRCNQLVVQRTAPARCICPCSACARSRACSCCCSRRRRSETPPAPRMSQGKVRSNHCIPKKAAQITASHPFVAKSLPHHLPLAPLHAHVMSNHRITPTRRQTHRQLACRITIARSVSRPSCTALRCSSSNSQVETCVVCASLLTLSTRV